MACINSNVQTNQNCISSRGVKRAKTGVLQRQLSWVEWEMIVKLRACASHMPMCMRGDAMLPFAEKVGDERPEIDPLWIVRGQTLVQKGPGQRVCRRKLINIPCLSPCNTWDYPVSSTPEYNPIQSAWEIPWEHGMDSVSAPRWHM